MYSMHHFTEKNRETLIEFMKHYSFAMLIVNDPNDTYAKVTQLPFLIHWEDEKLYLKAHLMRESDHCKALINQKDVLVVFTGANCYVSASWYKNPLSGSTWNYMSVHARGQLSFTSNDELIQILQELTQLNQNDSTSKASFDQLPQDYITQMTPHIVGIKIEVIHLENVFKLSQNKDSESYDNIISKLSSGNNQEQTIAQEMMKRKEK